MCHLRPVVVQEGETARMTRSYPKLALGWFMWCRYCRRRRRFGLQIDGDDYVIYLCPLCEDTLEDVPGEIDKALEGWDWETALDRLYMS